MTTREVLTIAHRGDPERHAENTTAGCVSAEAAGADMVEIDLRITADGVVVVHHDDHVGIRGLRRAVASLSCEALRARLGPDRAPAFADILEATRGPLMVDVKDATAARAAASMTAAHRSRLLLSGAAEDLEIARHALAGAAVALTWERRTYPRELLDRLGATWFNPSHRVLDAALVREAHADGRRVSTWTVDDPGLARSLMTAGVDAVITNRLRGLWAPPGA